MDRWESHISQHLLPSVLAISVSPPIHPGILWTGTVQKASSFQKGEKHRAASVQRKHPQMVGGMEKTCRVTDPPLPPSLSVMTEMWLETHKCWQGAVEGGGIAAAAA